VHMKQRIAAFLKQVVNKRDRNGRDLTGALAGHSRNGKKDILGLDGTQLREVREALLSAFPTHQDLEMMVFDQLNEHLSSLVRDGTLEHTVFELIQWAMAKGRLEELVIGAHKQNSQNPQLKGVAERLGLSNDQHFPHHSGTHETTHHIATASPVPPSGQRGEQLATASPVPLPEQRDEQQQATEETQTERAELGNIKMQQFAHSSIPQSVQNDLQKITEETEKTLLAQHARHYQDTLKQDQRLTYIKILDMDNRVPLTHLHVPQRLQRASIAHTTSDINKESDPNIILQVVRQRIEEAYKSQGIAPEKVLCEQKQCVVLGDPGSGKTTLLKYLTVQALNGQLAGLLDVLPIYI